MNEPSRSLYGVELVEVVIELLNAGRVTAEMLETSIRLHPELLGPNAQPWLSILAQAQDAPEARAAVNDVARILRRSRTESMDAVFSDQASRSRSQGQAGEARLRLAS